ncbi:hypothetical protein TOPH_06538 [Tolypocladium ophioglossoides CBS 100239]|uniref:Uncharacterized protein n=1 Tax=Tolypocladium ophioglossoides (strain CBS 100239) TaxID=1163406 RepID=A0A0L0N407_TOLOC|nr:hypothetical protein TOPH_06538 [Tolypocladium ophioglossoides CBS 100239]
MAWRNSLPNAAKATSYPLNAGRLSVFSDNAQPGVCLRPAGIVADAGNHVPAQTCTGQRWGGGRVLGLSTASSGWSSGALTDSLLLVSARGRLGRYANVCSTHTDAPCESDKAPSPAIHAPAPQLHHHQSPVQSSPVQSTRESCPSLARLNPNMSRLQVGDAAPPQKRGAAGIVSFYTRPNADGSLSSLNFRYARPDKPLSWTRILMNWQDLIRCRRAFVRAQFDEEEPGKPCSLVRYLHGALAPATPPKVRPGCRPGSSASTVGLGSLPVELQLQIFHQTILLSEPHTAKAVIHRLPRRAGETEAQGSEDVGRTLFSLVFWDCRTWRDIPYFSLCRSSRAAAMTLYGDPSTQLIPFCLSTDVLQLSLSEEFGYFGSCRAFEHLRSSSVRADEVWAYAPSASPTGQRACPVPDICRRRCPPRPLSGKRGPADFVTRTTRLSLKLMPLYELTIPWFDVWGLVGRLCPAVEHLTLLTAKTDVCVDDPRIPSRRDAGDAAWQEGDLLPILGVVRKLQDDGGEATFLPRVRVFEVRLVESICRRDMIAWSRGSAPWPASKSEFFDGALHPLLVGAFGDFDVWDDLT